MNVPLSPSLLRRLALLLGLLLTAAAPSFADGSGFEVLRAEVVKGEGQYRLNADIAYRFSDTAAEALRNGVPLTLVMRLNIQRDRRYWFDETVLDERRVFRIRYHSLAKLYQLVHVDSGSVSNFASLTAMLEDMGAIRDLPVIGEDRLVSGQRYRARLAVLLDIEALPLPLRPVAYLSPGWYLSSPWYKWSFAG